MKIVSVTREKSPWRQGQGGEEPCPRIPVDLIQSNIQPSLTHHVLFLEEDCRVCQGLMPNVKPPKALAFCPRKPFGSWTYHVPNIILISEEKGRNASWELRTTQTLKHSAVTYYGISSLGEGSPVSTSI